MIYFFKCLLFWQCAVLQRAAVHIYVVVWRSSNDSIDDDLLFKWFIADTAKSTVKNWNNSKPPKGASHCSRCFDNQLTMRSLHPFCGWCEVCFKSKKPKTQLISDLRDEIWGKTDFRSIIARKQQLIKRFIYVRSINGINKWECYRFTLLRARRSSWRVLLL